MAKRKRIYAEERAERREWERFKSSLETIKDLIDGLRFVNAGPRQGKPGGQYYSNLGFFLRRVAIPEGANPDELALYRGLSSRLEEARQFKPGTTEKLFGKGEQ